VLRHDSTKRKSNAPIQHLGSTSSSYPLAELSYLRGDYDAAAVVLRKRMGQGGLDFQTQNLFGATMAQSGKWAEAERCFLKLRSTTRSTFQREKATFNLALVLLYRDLQDCGDLSVSRTAFSRRIHSTFVRSSTPPFEESIALMKTCLRRSSPNAPIILTYLAYALLQHGDLDQALAVIIQALEKSESYFSTHFVTGKIFLDLTLLSMEGNDFMLDAKALQFFEIEPSEIVNSSGERSTVLRETLMNIAMQAFHDADELNPVAVEVLLALFQVYMLAGLYEDAHRLLQQVESIAPESLHLLDSQLSFFEQIQHAPELIGSLLKRLKSMKLREIPVQVQYLISPSFLL
jgi:tetratricopeptide (TPR) repeat protein